MTDEKNKRCPPISYRPPKGREAEFDALVAASGKSVNAFLNSCVFEKRPRSRVKAREAARKQPTAAALTDKLHEILLLADGRIALLAEAALDDAAVLRGELLDDMGRKP